MTLWLAFAIERGLGCSPVCTQGFNAGNPSTLCVRQRRKVLRGQALKRTTLPRSLVEHQSIRLLHRFYRTDQLCVEIFRDVLVTVHRVRRLDR